MTRTTQDAKELIEKAVVIMGAGVRSLHIESRCNFQRARSDGDDYRDWACWFLKKGDELPRWLLPAWYAFIGETRWDNRHATKAEIAVDKFKDKVPDALWAQGLKIEL